MSRANVKRTYPSDFLLLGATNPCPCGYLGDSRHSCRCSEIKIHNYHHRLSGPILDRIDIKVEVPRSVANSPIHSRRSTDTLLESVQRGRAFQVQRTDNLSSSLNSRIQGLAIEHFCVMTKSAQNLLNQEMRQRGLSQRSRVKILKLARSIADLDQSFKIKEEHLFEAVYFNTSPVGAR